MLLELGLTSGTPGQQAVYDWLKEVVGEPPKPVRLRLLEKRDLRNRQEAAARKLAYARSILESPISSYWTEAEKRRVAAGNVEAEAVRATLGALTRLSKRWGYKLVHTSKFNGVPSSRYFMSPEGDRVRLSDHSVPDTARRLDARGPMGDPTGWDYEVLVDTKSIIGWQLADWRKAMAGQL